MNYRHIFHAGNFADVFKHAVLARVLAHLRAKPNPFRVLDTHAGAGLYDLAGPQAMRGGEWQRGIGRLVAAPLPPELRALFAPYLDAVAALNPPGAPGAPGAAGALARYPGSPLIARTLMRPQDRLIACELEPTQAAALAAALRGDLRAKALPRDGFTALAAYLPPKERRGVVLIDPPFEAADEFARLAAALAAAQRKWASGIYLTWYPVKERGEPERLAQALKRLPAKSMLRAELSVRPLRKNAPLASAGLIVINPPWRLYEELERMLPALAKTLADDARGGFRLDWLRREI